MSGESSYVPDFFTPDSQPSEGYPGQIHYYGDAGTQWKTLHIHRLPRTTGEWVDQAGLEAANMTLPESPIS